MCEFLNWLNIFLIKPVNRLPVCHNWYSSIHRISVRPSEQFRHSESVEIFQKLKFWRECLRSLLNHGLDTQYELPLQDVCPVHTVISYQWLMLLHPIWSRCVKHLKRKTKSYCDIGDDDILRNTGLKHKFVLCVHGVVKEPKNVDIIKGLKHLFSFSVKQLWSDLFSHPSLLKLLCFNFCLVTFYKRDTSYSKSFV